MLKAKKIFGQHFLNDAAITQLVIGSLDAGNADYVLEIGPGKGVLTKTLLEKFGEKFYAVEIDTELCSYLLEKFPSLQGRLFSQSFLDMDLKKNFPGRLAVIGNFPYNISSQIVFKIIEHRENVTEMVGMFQKEMAKRIAAPPGGKDYGIISVFAQCWFKREYLFEIAEQSFTPPPKVKSAVIRLVRNQTQALDCDEALFIKIVKAGFNQRRKMLRNSLSQFTENKELLQNEIFELRPEQLPLEQFIHITHLFSNK